MKVSYALLSISYIAELGKLSIQNKYRTTNTNAWDLPNYVGVFNNNKIRKNPPLYPLQDLTELGVYYLVSLAVQTVGAGSEIGVYPTAWV